MVKQGDKIVAFGISDDLGAYVINLDNAKVLGAVALEVKNKDYYTEVYSLEIGTDRSYEVNFTLEKSTVALPPINVQAKKTPIRVESDTVTYNADSFKDGAEKVVEDLLKNLPGVEVEESGKIKYKGKEITKLLLDGDDLFDENYVTGSRNIGVDIIDKVEAIYNFSENYLLKGVEDSKKVALNLVLKKGITDWSGNANLAYGIVDRYNADVNLIGVAKTDKNFSTISYNNIGENNSPKNYFGQQSSIDEASISDYLAPKLIPEEVFYSPLSPQRANRNKSLFGSVNHIHKFSDRLSARMNLNYIQDHLAFNKESSIAYFLPNQEPFQLSTQENVVKKPQYMDANVQLIWKVNDKSMLEYKLKWFDEKLKTPTALLSNQTDNLNSHLSSRSYFLMNTLDYTWRLSANKALLLQAVTSSYAGPQNYQIDTGFDLASGAYLINQSSEQYARTAKDHYEISATLMGARKASSNKYLLKFGGKLKQNNLKTYLNLGQNISFENNMSLKNYNLYQISEYNFKLGKYVLKPTLQIDYNHIKFATQIDSTFQRISLNPKLNIRRRVSRNSNIMLDMEYKETPTDFYQLYNRFLLKDFRTLQRNESKFVHQKKWNTMAAWLYNDDYNLFRTTASVGYYKSKNNFFTRNVIQPDFTIYDRFILAEDNQGVNVLFGVQKFVDAMSSTIKFNTFYTRANYRNMVNNSGLRDNVSHVVNSELFYKTAFDIPVNFQNILKYTYMINKVKDSSFKQQFSSLQNDFKVFFRPNEIWFSSLTFAYYQPDLARKNPYYFLDFHASYKPKDKNWDLALDAKNLLGNKSYSNHFINDYSKSTFSQSLINRYVMMTFSFKF